MALALNEEQRSLRDTAREFARQQSPIEAFRKLRDSNDSTGYDLALWDSMVELGWSGMIFPESVGGFDFGVMGLAGCMEEFGRTLIASPLMSSVILSGSCIFYAGTDAQKTEWLPQIIGNQRRFALALDEGAHHAPTHIATTAVVDGTDYVLNGTKRLVIDGHTADTLLVAARTSGASDSTTGITLFMIDANAPGICRERISLVDSRAYATVQLNQVRIPAQAVLGDVGQAFTALDKALDMGRICLAAEMFGGMQEIFERTVQYLKERKQFGVLIGTFQALQHRVAHLYTELEMCKSLLMLALDALEQSADNAPQLVSAAKARLNDVYELVSNEATQLHGGIGVTDELDIGLFLKRARVSAHLLGNSRFHYDRYARLEGF